ncbi:MAG: CHAP domain-containing protein, partial [Clostridiales bacterium]|nr:CHAP domain-containing protein [Clostridiales bacterium]
MNKFKKGIFSLFLAMIFVLSGIVTNVSVSSSWPATKGIKTYCLSTKNDTKVYKTATSKDGSSGTIYASDLITINGYDKSSKRIKVTYPISKGTKTGYIPLSAVTGGTWNSASGTFTAAKQVTTYCRASNSSKLGYISKGDKCYKIATSGKYTQIIYPISGGYKMGWLKTSEIPDDDDDNSDNSGSSSSGFTPRTSAPAKSNQYYYSSKNPFYSSGYGMPNCTAYAYGRAYEILGNKPKLSTSDASKWYSYNKQNKYYSYGSTPKLGAIACWSGGSSGAGHVAVVEKIDGNKVTISESHYYSKVVFDTKT